MISRLCRNIIYAFGWQKYIIKVNYSRHKSIRKLSQVTNSRSRDPIGKTVCLYQKRCKSNDYSLHLIKNVQKSISTPSKKFCVFCNYNTFRIYDILLFFYIENDSNIHFKVFRIVMCNLTREFMEQKIKVHHTRINTQHKFQQKLLYFAPKLKSIYTYLKKNFPNQHNEK